MPLKITKKEGVTLGGTSMKNVLKKFQKELGEDVGNFGGYTGPIDRVPTGLFPLDLALGGGFPRGKASTIFGPESSNKTNIVLSAIRMHQLIWPEKTNCFISVEGFDVPWAKTMGVDTDKVIVVQPNYAEEVVDMAEKFLSAEDCGIVAIDSLAAMISTQEANKSATEMNPGKSAFVVGALVRKTTLSLNAAELAGRFPTLLYINQIRSKIGVMYGSPETTPGGYGPLYQSNIRLRVYGKSILDPKVSKVLPVFKQVKFTVPKSKCPIIAAEGMFNMVTVPHNGWKVGECDDWNTVSSYMKSLGLLVKHEKKGWVMLGEHYNVLDDCEARTREDKMFGNKARQAIIGKLLEGGDMLENVGGEEDDAPQSAD
jgi:recombination protein RecA